MKKLIFYIPIICLLAITSCQKFVEIDLPKSQITTEYVFSDSTNANSAIAGIYVDMMQAFSLGFSSGGITAFTGLASDELYLTANNQNSEFFASNILPTNSTNLALWNSAYKTIYATNACMEGIEASMGLTENQRNVLLGEVLFIRSFIYFNLVNLYGPVPLALSTNYQINRLLSRSNETEIYEQLITDLVRAKSLLPKRPVTANTRAGHYAASALLSRVHLYMENYTAAKDEATNVISSQFYNMEQNLDGVFAVNSKEIIWGLSPVYPGRETWEGYYFVPTTTTSVPTYVITEHLFNSFQPLDQRKSSWIRINVNNGRQYPLPYKYKLGTMVTSIKERYSVLRLAELYLIRAEAHARLNETISGENDLNVTRSRAGLQPLVGSTQSVLINLIQEERRFEFICEWGHRWFDLKRTDRVDEILTPIKPNWKPSASFFPIPQTEINNNPNLTQNNGY